MNNLETGSIRTTRKGAGYFRNSEYKDGIKIENEDLNTALNHDKVRIKILGKNKWGDLTGSVEEIISRNKTVFVGTAKEVTDESGNVEISFNPDENAFYPKVEILNFQKFKNLDDKKVLLKLNEWKDMKSKPQMTILDVLGTIGDHETEMKAAVLDRGLVMGFPSEVEEAAKEIKEKSAQLIEEARETRRDMTDRVNFTIDPFDAKDFDDALSVKTLDNGDYEIGVHIADPSFYVTPGGVLDKEAVSRATSIYLVDRTIPMLPEVLSNDLCSLNPNEEKMTFSAVFIMDKDANIKDRWFGETITKSIRRFNYLEAQEILDKGEGDNVAELKILTDLAHILRKEKVKNGAISFGSTEVKFKLDENHFPYEVYEKEHVFMMEMIEEFMLLANREVSRFVSVNEDGTESKKPFIYRVHDKPKMEKVSMAADFLSKAGYSIKLESDGNISSKEINRVIKDHIGTPEEDLVSMTMLRSMQKAVYSTKNLGHFGLAFQYYSHFTSPIRRYPDMIAHRLLRRYLAGENVDRSEIKQIQELADHSSEMEQKAVTAERESIKFKYAQYYSKRIGEEFYGQITGVAKFGMFVQNIKTKGEGFVAIREIGDDYYEFDDKKLVIRGKNNNQKFRIGDKVKTKVTDVDIVERRINLTMKI